MNYSYVFLIAQDVLEIEDGETVTNTRVCHNFGAWHNRKLALAKANRLNKVLDENEGDYYVFPMTLNLS